MKSKRTVLILLAALGLCGHAEGQTSKTTQTILPGTNKVELTWLGKAAYVPVKANNEFTIATNKNWAKATRSADGKMIIVTADTTTESAPRTANITLKTADGTMSRTIQITQEEEKIYESLLDDTVEPQIYEASSSQSNQGIARLFDGNTNTAWASKYGVSEDKPVTVTMSFNGKERVDYIVYTPRQTSGTTGTWQKYTVIITAQGKTYTQNITSDGDTTPDTIKLETPVSPDKIEIRITEALNNCASGAELTCYRAGTGKDELKQVFADEVYSELKPGVTQEDVNKLTNVFCKRIAQGLLDGTYSTEYRAASYPCRLSYRVLSDEWNAPGKYYSQIDNPTGINFRTGTKRAVYVSGIPDDISVQLAIVAWYNGKDGNNFDGAYPHTTDYTLHNGLNIIDYTYDYDGLAYIKYYADTRARYEQGVPDIKVHFISGEENGILTLKKTNNEMYEMCNKAANWGNVCIDVLGSRVQSIWTSAGMRDYCKASDGTSYGYRQYINLLDSLVAWEHRQLGLEKYNRIPDNHTMAFTNYVYYMFQTTMGVSFHHNQESRVLNCQTMMLKDWDAIWGFSHEWGHQHQMHPYACWGGLGEVSNNIFSYYNVEHLGYVDKKIDKGFRNMFYDKKFNSYFDGYSQGKAYSKLRRQAYESAKSNTSLYSYSTDLRNACLAEADSLMYNVDENPLRSVNILDNEVGVILSPFNILGNYATIKLNYADFYPDLFESLRQQNNLPGGSTIEKTDGFDKYELISAAQNSNINSLYTTLAEKYPESCWVTENYLNKGNTNWNENSAPAMLCFVRKASRLYGYNLFNFFERAGFLRVGAYQNGDYGTKYQILTQKMYDEFKADMTALETDGTLKPMTDTMLQEMFYIRDFNESSSDKMYPTPEIPN